MVLSGTLRQLDTLRAQVSPEVAAINEFPRLDPARVLRIYKKLNIASVEELKQSLASGEIAQELGARMDALCRRRRAVGSAFSAGIAAARDPNGHIRLSRQEPK
jgi:hypothetical protein